MPSLKAIRKRITSVKNTQKITRAMKLVAAARLRRAQDTIFAARPYSEALARVVADLAEHTGRDAHPLLAERNGRAVQVVVLTSDRGLAGSFNAQILRRLEGIMRGEELSGSDIKLRIVGRKGNDYVKRRYQDHIVNFANAPTGDTALDFSHELTNAVVDDFLAGKVDRVVLMYNEFVSAISQDVQVRQLLPVVPAQAEAEAAAGEVRAGDFVFEPSKESLLSHLVPLYVQNGIYRACLESIASELGSRMSAMDSATKNAGEMIDRLSLDYNRARQAAITKELLEIISGAESLKG